MYIWTTPNLRKQCGKGSRHSFKIHVQVIFKQASDEHRKFHIAKSKASRITFGSV